MKERDDTQLNNLLGGTDLESRAARIAARAQLRVAAKVEARGDGFGVLSVLGRPSLATAAVVVSMVLRLTAPSIHSEASARSFLDDAIGIPVIAEQAELLSGLLSPTPGDLGRW